MHTLVQQFLLLPAQSKMTSITQTPAFPLQIEWLILPSMLTRCTLTHGTKGFSIRTDLCTYIVHASSKHTCSATQQHVIYVALQLSQFGYLVYSVARKPQLRFLRCHKQYCVFLFQGIYLLTQRIGRHKDRCPTYIVRTLAHSTVLLYTCGIVIIQTTYISFPA